MKMIRIQKNSLDFLSDTNSEGMYLKYYNHFDGYHRIYRIPELIELCVIYYKICLKDIGNTIKGFIMKRKS